MRLRLQIQEKLFIAGSNHGFVNVFGEKNDSEISERPVAAVRSLVSFIRRIFFPLPLSYVNACVRVGSMP